MDRLKKQLCAALKTRLAGGTSRLPEAGLPLWEAFGVLSRARSYNPHGPNPITWEAIAAYSQLMRVPLEPRHVDIITALDAVWIEDAYRIDKQTPEGVKTLPPLSQHPINAGLLDAMLG
ncbi:phage tail assembly chaperone [Paracoccus sp. 22332]|uniref:phage tail assembly chaperone n=1 Tax=Paracoccus sp. 22332 TaxID=3453913 RepID=UPI003F86352A